MIVILIALIAAPMPGPDMSVLSRPIAGPYTNLLYSTDVPHDYDVIAYDVSIEVFPSLEMLECTTEVIFTPEISGLDLIRLDLVELTVDSVWDATGALSYSQVASVSSIPEHPGTRDPEDSAVSGSIVTCTTIWV